MASLVRGRSQALYRVHHSEYFMEAPSQAVCSKSRVNSVSHTSPEFLCKPLQPCQVCQWCMMSTEDNTKVFKFGSWWKSLLDGLTILLRLGNAKSIAGSPLRPCASDSESLLGKKCFDRWSLGISQVFASWILKNYDCFLGEGKKTPTLFYLKGFFCKTIIHGPHTLLSTDLNPAPGKSSDTGL